jgi:transcription elongation factor Elf1
MATTFTQENREYVPKVWEEVPCPFCGAQSHRPHEKYGPHQRYTYVQCRSCGLVYATPRPRYDEDFIAAAYSVYDTESHHLKEAGRLDEGERNLVERYKVTVRQISRHLGRTGRLLDVGCATGLFLLAAREEGWEVVGIDISSAMVESAKQIFGFETYCGQYHQTHVTEGGRFDAIYAVTSSSTSRTPTSG